MTKILTKLFHLAGQDDSEDIGTGSGICKLVQGTKESESKPVAVE